MWLQFRANPAGRYIEMRIRRVDLTMGTEGIKAFSKRIRRCSVDGRKRYENDKCGCKSFWKRSKTAPFSFGNGLVWTRPKSPLWIYLMHENDSSTLCSPVNWMRARYLMLQGQMDYAMMYLDRVSSCRRPTFAQCRPHASLMCIDAISSSNLVIMD